MKKQFTEKDLVDFGNYLLSFKRKETIKKEVNKRKVHDCDLANFKEIQKQIFKHEVNYLRNKPQEY